MKNLNFHIAKREPMAWYKSVLVRAFAILASLVVSGVVIMLLTNSEKAKQLREVASYRLNKFFKRHKDLAKEVADNE